MGEPFALGELAKVIVEAVGEMFVAVAKLPAAWTEVSRLGGRERESKQYDVRVIDDIVVLLLMRQQLARHDRCALSKVRWRHTEEQVRLARLFSSTHYRSP